jgi:hypothetical protein
MKILVSAIVLVGYCLMMLGCGSGDDAKVTPPPKNAVKAGTGGSGAKPVAAPKPTPM